VVGGGGKNMHDGIVRVEVEGREREREREREKERYLGDCLWVGLVEEVDRKPLASA